MFGRSLTGAKLAEFFIEVLDCRIQDLIRLVGRDSEGQALRVVELAIGIDGQRQKPVNKVLLDTDIFSRALT
jgi:hypothetical protein